MKLKIFLTYLFLISTSFAQTKAKNVDSGYPLDLNSLNLNLPKTDDVELSRLLKESIFYKLSPVWQHYVPASKIQETNVTLGTISYKTKPMFWGIYHVKYNPDSHANFNFPWETTVGLNSVKKEQNLNFHTINFINLPKKADGKFHPIWILREAPVKWIYPCGTTVGEIIYVSHENSNYIQEIRTRKKSEDSNYWEPAVYRPISNRNEYIRLTNDVDYIPAKKHMFFRNPQEDEVYKMDGLVERLPALSNDEVKFLLSQKFKNVTEENWSPSSDQEFHILPKNYCFSLIGSVDTENCSNCHRQTQISVRNLVPKDPSVILDPDGTGNIRGSDAVFTWHPFSYSSVKSSLEEKTSPTKFRNFDMEKGLITTEPNDTKLYKLTLFVQKSLKDYEIPKNKSVLHEEIK